jgi:hypothetical protein
MWRSALLVAALSLGVLAGTATPVSATAHGARPATCAFDKNGRRLGCLAYGEDCNISVEGRMAAGWLFAMEGIIPPADANAQRLRPRYWRIREWPSRTLLGYATTEGTNLARWKVSNSHKRVVATVRGPWGPHTAMVLLKWGAQCLE